MGLDSGGRMQGGRFVENRRCEDERLEHNGGNDSEEGRGLLAMCVLEDLDHDGKPARQCLFLSFLPGIKIS